MRPVLEEVVLDHALNVFLALDPVAPRDGFAVVDEKEGWGVLKSLVAVANRLRWVEQRVELYKHIVVVVVLQNIFLFLLKRVDLSVGNTEKAHLV